MRTFAYECQHRRGLRRIIHIVQQKMLYVPPNGNLFEQYWQHCVRARIPAHAYDKMNENFFRTTFTSRCLDVMTTFYSFETEYNTRASA